MTDPTIYGDTLMKMSFSRIKTNIMVFISLLFVIPFIRFKIDKRYQRINLFLFLYLFFNIISVLLAEDIYQSLFLLPIAVIFPICYYYLLLSIDYSYFKDIGFINKTISIIFCFCFFCGVAFIIYDKGLSSISFLELRVGNGIWINNFSLQILSTIIPIIILRDYPNAKMLKIISIVFIALMELIAMSRTLLAVFFIQLLLMVYYKMLKKSTFLWVLSIFGLFILILSTQFDLELFKIILERFDGQGNLYETTTQDARFFIYEEAIKIIRDHPWFGIGIGNFYKYTPDRFSDAHNLFLSQLLSRGFIVFVLTIIALIAFFIKNIAIAKQVSEASKKLILCLRIGIIGFILASLTGSDLFIYSGLCNAWPMYFIILLFVLQEKIFESLKNDKIE